MATKKPTYEVLTGKIFKIFDNKWGVSILLNVRDETEDAWELHEVHAYRASQNGMCKFLLSQKEQSAVKISATKYNGENKLDNIKQRWIIRQIKLIKPNE